MKQSVTRYPLSRFDGLVPLLMQCFPDFWGPRLQRKLRSFPYDLRLFTAEIEGRLTGCIGLHGYPFLLGNSEIRCYGVSDVAVDPDFRGKGYSIELQQFVIAYCRKRTDSGFLPLYTDKPGVYQRLGWRVYESDRTGEIRIEDFPKRNTFHLNYRKLRLSFLRGKGAALNEEERVAGKIMKLYRQGRTFPGKCLRSGKTWWELFADPEYEWLLEDDAYFLYRGDVLFEAYSTNPEHPVNAFTPRHGGHDDNKVMINFVKNNQIKDDISAAVNAGTLVFPAADVF